MTDPIEEVYQRHQHLDCLLSDSEWAGEHLINRIAVDFGLATKAYAGLRALTTRSSLKKNITVGSITP